MTLKNIYTYGGEPAKRLLTVAELIANKGKRTYTSTVPGTQEEAEACAEAGIDHLAIWDKCYSEIRDGAPHTFINAGLGMSDYATPDDILRAAITAADAGADAIFTPRSLGIVEMLAREGLSVQGHVGLIPRRSTQFGGLRAVGRTAEEAIKLMEDFRRYEDAGAYAVEVECVATEALIEINKHTRLVTHSIGSGSGGDVILMYLEDICGDAENPPRHAKAFGNLRAIRKQLADERVRALNAFKGAVDGGAFPDAAHSITMDQPELDKFREALDKRPRF